MRDAIESCAFLTVGIDYVPGALLRVGVSEHFVLSTRVVHPVASRLNVHSAEIPALDGIAHALLESFLLLLIVHGEPVFDQNDAGTDEHFLEQGAESQEFPILFIGAEV